MGPRQVRKRLLATVQTCAVVLAALALGSCSQNVDSKYGVTSSVRVVGPGKPVPKGGGKYRVGDPYVIAGRTYVPQEDSNYRAEGLASWYGSDFHGRLTANGEVFDMYALSAAHPTLPLPSYVRIINLENHRSVVVRVNDRGPYHDNRVIDVSVRAAKILGFFDRGVAQVRVEYVGRAALEGSDDAKLAQSLRIEDPVSPLPRVAASEQAAPITRPGSVTSYAPEPVHSVAIIGRGLY